MKGQSVNDPLPIAVPEGFGIKPGDRFSMKVPCDPASGRMLCGSGPPFPADSEWSVMLDRWFVATLPNN
jgi:hypothetical protein